jgi:hypothetical protein
MFDKTGYEVALKELPSLVGTNTMAAAMGATRSEFARLVEDGILKPVVPQGTIKTPWRIDDGLDLVAKLKSSATGTIEIGTEWKSLLQARNLTGATFKDIICAIYDNELILRQLAHRDGFSSFVVHALALDGFRRQPLGTEIKGDYITPAAFARQIGIREKGVLQNFFEAGLSPSRRTDLPVGNGQTLMLSVADTRLFHTHFVTPTTLSQRTGLHRNFVISVIRKNGIAPVKSQDQAFPQIYRVDDIRKLFPELELADASILASEPVQ